MTELDLHKFLEEKEVEMRWDENVLSTWIYAWHLADFTELAESFLKDEGADARYLSDGSIWIDLVPVCEYYGIEPERIFPTSA